MWLNVHIVVLTLFTQTQEEDQEAMAMNKIRGLSNVANCAA